MTRVIGDIRMAVRYLRRRPVIAVVVCGTLAVGVGMATTAFGVARSVLWRGLPFSDAGSLVFVWEDVDRDGQRAASRVTGARFAAWRSSDSGFNSLSLFGAAGFTVEGPQGASSVRGVRVSANYFDTLGVAAAVGRTFVADDEQPGNHRVVILSDVFWRERFGGRPEAVGEVLRLSGEPYRVVGVLPPATYPAWPVNPATVTLDADARQLWVPIQRTPALDQSARAHVFGVVARLRHGTSPTQAAEKISGATDRTAADPHLARVEPVREHFVREARTPLLALTAAALVVLLIACANLAALYVSVFESRRGELTTRMALGAGIPQLVRQFAFESFVLAGIGGGLGMLASRATLAAVPAWLPANVPFLTPPAFDGITALFGAALSVVAGVGCAAWPMVRMAALAPMPRAVAWPQRHTIHRVVVASQLALTMGLVPVAALLGQSLRSVETVDPGVAVDRMFVANVGLPATAPASAIRIVQAEQALLAAVAARPNVIAAAVAYDHPFEANWSETPTLVGEVPSASDEPRQAELRIVSPGYVEALGVRLLAGRTLTARDSFDAPGVALVNEAFAREMDGRVIGRRLRSGTPRFMYGDAAPNEFEIVGVVANERVRGLERPGQPAFYLSTRQFPQTGVTLLVRTAGDPLSSAADLRSTVRGVDDRITFDGATSLDAVLATQLIARRVTTNVIGAFAATALLLAALGVYGLLTIMVGTRTREIGVRLAIGASPRSVARQVIADALKTATLGITLGSALSIPATRFVEHLLVGVTGGDALTLGTSAAVMLAVATAATLVPARRAAQIDPAITLRAGP